MSLIGRQYKDKAVAPKTLQQVVNEQRRLGVTYEEKRERLGQVHLYVFNLLTGRPRCSKVHL